VVEGDAAAALVADSAGDDLLFTGSRRRGPVRRVLPGSVSARVVRDVACPVVVVPRGG
jgi:nucleotide-binding universal stress UspA family protein